MDSYQRVAYFRLDSFDLGGFPASYGSRLVASIGSRSSLIRNSKEFDILEKNPQKNWELKYHNPNTTSFVFTIAKKRIFGGDIHIGEIELKISNFELNKVVKCEVRLNNNMNPRLKPIVTLSVHVCNDGSFPFNAPPGKLNISSPSICNVL